MDTGPCDRFVLVVDDDADIRESLADVLLDEGYSVLTASDGRDALAKLRTSEAVPCLILLDLMMPVMNGSQFCVEKQRDPALAPIPVVVISADGNVQQKAAAVGGDYLAKPLRLEQVLQVLERHC